MIWSILVLWCVIFMMWCVKNTILELIVRVLWTFGLAEIFLKKEDIWSVGRRSWGLQTWVGLIFWSGVTVFASVWLGVTWLIVHFS